MALALATTTSHAAIFSAVSSGNWSEPTTWNQSGSVPGSGDEILTLAGHDVTVDVNVTIGNGTGFALAIGNSSRLILAEGPASV